MRSILSLFYTPQHTQRLLSLLCLHQSLSGDGSQQYPPLPCSRSYRLVTTNSFNIKVKVKTKVTSRPTVSGPVRFGEKPRLGPNTIFWLLSDSCWFVHVARSLWGEDGSVVYYSCWSSPAQSYLPRSHCSNCLPNIISALIAYKTPFLCCCFQLLSCSHACLRSRYSVTPVV
jgi:hypothetical protein